MGGAFLTVFLYKKNTHESENHVAVRLVLRHSLHLGVVEERREDLVFGTFVRALLSRRLLFLRLSFFCIACVNDYRRVDLFLSIVGER